MPSYISDFHGERHRFADLKDVLAKASHRRSGDELAGLAAETGAKRVAARSVLADLPLATFLNEPIIPYETDEVTRLILDSHDTASWPFPTSPSAVSATGCCPTKRRPTAWPRSRPALPRRWPPRQPS